MNRLLQGASRGKLGAALAGAGLILASAGGCSSSAPVRGTPGERQQMVNTLSKAQLEGTWHLTHLAGATIDPSHAMQRPCLRFDAGKIAGKGAVNNISGSYSLAKPNNLRFGPVVSTMMARSPAAMDLEQRFVSAIEDVRSAGVLDQFLTLRDGSGKEILRMAREVEEPRGVSLEQLRGEWVAVTIQGVSTSSDRTPTLMFEEASEVGGHSGVNRFRGNLDSASVAQGAIKMGPFGATRMAGPPELMRQEQRFLSALEQARTIRLSGGQLVLANGDTTLMMLRRR